MKKLLIITGFESSGSAFLAQIVSFVTGKCIKFGDWNGFKWKGQKGDHLVVIHRSMPYGRAPKKWLSDLETEIEGMEDYERSYVICTRDLNISKLSRSSRFGASPEAYLDDDEKARKIFSKLIEEENTYIFSFESSVALGDAYYQIFYRWLNVTSDFSPPVRDANKPYVRPK